MNDNSEWSMAAGWAARTFGPMLAFTGLVLLTGPWCWPAWAATWAGYAVGFASVIWGVAWVARQDRPRRPDDPRGL